MTIATVLPLFKNLDRMSPAEVLGHLDYLRRTVRNRAAERESLDQTALPATQFADLTRVAFSDYSMLHKLDMIEAGIGAELNSTL